MMRHRRLARRTAALRACPDDRPVLEGQPDGRGLEDGLTIINKVELAAIVVGNDSGESSVRRTDLLAKRRKDHLEKE